MARPALKAVETNQPDDDAIAAVNLSRVRAAERDLATAKGDFKETIELAAGNGIHVKAAKLAFKIIADGGAAKWLEESAAVTRYLRILRHGLDEDQLSLFEAGRENLEPNDEKASNDGRAWGLDGGDETKNPHELGNQNGQAWLAGCRQGLSERALILSMHKADAADDSED